MLRTTQKTAVKCRRAALQQLHNTIVAAPEDVRDQVRNLTRMQRLRTCAAWRPDIVGYRDPVVATKLSLKYLARRVLDLNDEIAELDRFIVPLVEELAPNLLELEGVGIANAGEVMVAAGENPDRLRSEASFAMMCGACPIPASSGKTQRHRLKGFERCRQPSRKPFPEHLARERVVVPAPESCTCCGSQRLSKVGEDVTETLEVIPRQWKVIQTVREKFSCRDCEKLSQSPAPYHAVPRGWAGANLLATIVFEKCGQHQPLNRQSERYAREGVALSVSTLADQVGACAFALRPVHELIAAHVLPHRRWRHLQASRYRPGTQARRVVQPQNLSYLAHGQPLVRHREPLVNGGVKPRINGEQRVAEATTCRVERQRIASRQAALRLLRCAPAPRVTRRNPLTQVALMAGSRLPAVNDPLCENTAIQKVNPHILCSPLFGAFGSPSTPLSGKSGESHGDRLSRVAQLRRSDPVHRSGALRKVITFPPKSLITLPRTGSARRLELRTCACTTFVTRWPVMPL